MNKASTEKHFWVLGSILSLVFLPVIFITGFALGVFYEGSIGLAQDDFSSWITALATVSIAILTLVLAKETWSLRSVQLNQIEQVRKGAIQPSVSLAIKSSSVSISFKDVIIVNNGNGSAHEVKFLLEGGNPENDEIYDYLEAELLSLNILKSGISSLGVGEVRTSHVFDFHNLYGKFGDAVFRTYISVVISYKDIEGRELFSRAKIDFAEYIGVSRVGDNPMNSISESLKDIRKEIQKLTRGVSYKRFEVNTYTAKDRNDEARKRKNLTDTERASTVR